MITDAQNRPSNAQALAGALGATIISVDSIDLLTANRNVGRAFPMRMHAVLNTPLAGGSVRAEVIESNNGNLTGGTVIATGPTVAAGAAAGTKLLDVPIPGTTRRYLGVQYVGSVGAITGGTVTAHVVAETDNQTYPAMNTGL